MHLEHDDNMALIKDVAWGVDSHAWEVLNLLWIPAHIVIYTSLGGVSDRKSCGAIKTANQINLSK